MNRWKQESCECKESLVMYKSDWDGQCYCKLYNFGGAGVYCWLCHICVGILALIVIGGIAILVLGIVLHLLDQSEAFILIHELSWRIKLRTNKRLLWYNILLHCWWQVMLPSLWLLLLQAVWNWSLPWSLCDGKETRILNLS